jgi:hypothetical protein
MSETISVGVVGRSYWVYMANVMAEYLGQIIQAKRIQSRLAEIPQGVYKDAQEFFRLVLQAVEPGFSENPPASTNAYMIAADSLRGSSTPIPETDPELEMRLKQYQFFIERLQEPHRLNSDELNTAQALHDFFVRLAQDGESEVYERSVCSVTQPSGLRFL